MLLTTSLAARVGLYMAGLAPAMHKKELSPRKGWWAFFAERVNAFQIISTLVDGLAQRLNAFKDVRCNRTGIRQDAQLLLYHGQDERGLGGDALGKVIGPCLQLGGFHEVI